MERTRNSQTKETEGIWQMRRNDTKNPLIFIFFRGTKWSGIVGAFSFTLRKRRQRHKVPCMKYPRLPRTRKPFFPCLETIFSEIQFSPPPTRFPLINPSVKKTFFLFDPAAAKAPIDRKMKSGQNKSSSSFDFGLRERRGFPRTKGTVAPGLQLTTVSAPLTRAVQLGGESAICLFSRVVAASFFPDCSRIDLKKYFQKALG